LSTWTNQSTLGPSSLVVISGDVVEIEYDVPIMGGVEPTGDCVNCAQHSRSIVVNQSRRVGSDRVCDARRSSLVARRSPNIIS
jgi:hypothetical protein